jgi:hypothetical protein
MSAAASRAILPFSAAARCALEKPLTNPNLSESRPDAVPRQAAPNLVKKLIAGRFPLHSAMSEFGPQTARPLKQPIPSSSYT